MVGVLEVVMLLLQGDAIYAAAVDVTIWTRIEAKSRIEHLDIIICFTDRGRSISLKNNCLTSRADDQNYKLYFIPKGLENSKITFGICSRLYLLLATL